MVRVLNGILVVFVSFAVSALGRPINVQATPSDVQNDIREIVAGPLPQLYDAVNSLPDNQLPSQQLLTNLALKNQALVNALNHGDTDINNVAGTVSYADAKAILTQLGQNQAKIDATIDLISFKADTTFSGSAGIRFIVGRQLKRFYDAYVTPELKSEGKALFDDGIGRLVVALGKYGVEI
ncbi:hypothetical protein VNI00_002457 [Paramarasmius palmivorus]|uniref:Uncharacterized protein n=1 Tax=Paramarasmius palmivorus TaxID=297713 RepID=A0AAW0DXL0_9AGAR